MPGQLRDMVSQGFRNIKISVDARTALRIADDIEFAVKECPDGSPDGAGEVYKYLKR
ncbi:MAG: hypothetical protein AAF986_08250 [Pseudomonadota bacterium]